MAYEQGDVWWGLHHTNLDRRTDRELLSVTVPIRSHTRMYRTRDDNPAAPGAITVPDDAWIDGGSDADAYISPWYTTTIKHRDFDRRLRNNIFYAGLSLTHHAFDARYQSASYAWC